MGAKLSKASATRRAPVWVWVELETVAPTLLTQGVVSGTSFRLTEGIRGRIHVGSAPHAGSTSSYAAPLDSRRTTASTATARPLVSHPTRAINLCGCGPTPKK